MVMAVGSGEVPRMPWTQGTLRGEGVSRSKAGVDWMGCRGYRGRGPVVCRSWSLALMFGAQDRTGN